MADALLSVIRIAASGADPRECESLAAWIGKQTCARACDAVVWERNARTAFVLSDPGRRWHAQDGAELLERLDTKYVCIADDDLLRQHETYLEENLIALKAGALAFTVNLQGQADWALEKIRSGLLPGSPAIPLLRQVVRRDCLRSDLSLDLSAWIRARKGFSTVAGRIVRHLTNLSDPPESLPFDARLAEEGAETAVEGMQILARARTPGEWGAPLARVHPIEAVLPEVAYPTDLPITIMVHTYLAVGGAERIHLNLMRELKARMHFVVVGIEPLDPALGTTADEFRRLTPFVYTLPDFLHPSMNLSFLCSLIGQCRPAALYMANGANFMYDALPELKHRFPGLRIVNQVYDHTIGWINRYSPPVVASLDAHIAVNRKICRAYEEKGAPPEEVHLIENGIIPREFEIAPYDGPRIAAIKAALELPPDRKIVTFAARIHEQKRPLDFVELAESFAGDPSVAFLMAGDGPLAEEVSHAVAAKGLRNLFRRPFYSPMSDLYAITDVFVLPSSFEGMPMVVIEAQVMGKPVVVTDVGNNREVVEATGGGVVIGQIGDIRELADGVRAMLLHPPDARRLREAALARYDIAIVAEKYRRVLMGPEWS